MRTNYSQKAGLGYNPDDVNIRMQHFTVAELVGMIKEKNIDILSEDDLQRNSGLWDQEKKSLFIESLMIKLPIPMFYFDGGQKPWRIIDGLQRLYTINSFLDTDYTKSFKLKNLEFLGDECNGKYFEDLPGYLKGRIMGSQLEAYVINPGTPDEVKYNIFKRINTGGLTLKGQEIRNAFCRGFAVDFTKKLAALDEFKQVTNQKVPTRRMEDREYVTRFIAFQQPQFYDFYSKSDSFLTEALIFLDKDKLPGLEASFSLTCKRIYNVLGEKALYRINRDNSFGSKPNKALFDTLAWNFNNLSEKEYNYILSNKELFIQEYRSFMVSNDLIYKSISDTTGSKTAVKNRFVEMNNFLKNFVK